MTVFKVLTGLVFGAATAVFTITFYRRHRRVRRAWERCRDRRPQTTEKAQALARAADEATATGDGTQNVASDRCVLQAQARALARMS